MKRLWKILISVGVLVAFAILGSIARHYQLRATTNAYIAELKAKGEPMELSQVIPPPLPPGQNSADVFRKAAALFKADDSLLATNSYSGMRMVASGKAMIVWKQPDARDDFATNSWEELAAAVAQNADSLRLLHQIVEKPAFDFHMDYSGGVADLNFTNLLLAESKRAALRLGTAALCDLHRGDAASAVKDVRAMMAIVKGMKDERLVISELVHIALDATWELLQSPILTDEELAAIQNDWASLEFVSAEEQALEMERVTGEITLLQWRKSNYPLMRHFDAWQNLGFADEHETAFDKVKLRTKIFLWRYWWSYPDELEALKGYQALLEASRFASTNYCLQCAEQVLEGRLAALVTSTNDELSLFANPNKADMHTVISASITYLSRAFNKVIIAEAAKQLTTTAVALKRYQAKRGDYPSELTRLVPDFFSAVPRDPVDGKPLRYRLNSDGTFLLYSIGEDGNDDGGDASPADHSTSFQWQRGRDWVWPQPATPE